MEDKVVCSDNLSLLDCEGFIIIIGHFHDDDVSLQLLEFISSLFSYLNLSIPLRFKEQQP